MADRTVNYSSTTGTTLDNTGEIKLGDGDSNSVKFRVGRGFTSNPTTTAQVTKLTLYNWDTTKANNQGSLIGTWNRSSATTEPFTYLDITTSGNDISVADTNTTPDEYDYCYTVTVTDAGGDHTTADPELRVKKKTTG